MPPRDTRLGIPRTKSGFTFVLLSKRLAAISVPPGLGDYPGRRLPFVCRFISDTDPRYEWIAVFSTADLPAAIDRVIHSLCQHRDSKIMSLSQKGLAGRAIAAQVGVTEQTVSTVLSGQRDRERSARERAAELLREGFPPDAVAKATGLTQGQIRHLAARAKY